MPSDPVPWTPSALAAANVTSVKDAENWLRSIGVDPSTIDSNFLEFAVSDARDRQYAESVKYGNSALILIPLKSGRFAIFDRGFTFVDFLNGDFDSAENLREISIESEAHLRSIVLHVERLRSIGAAESNDREFGRQLRRARTEPRSRSVVEIGVDIDMDSL